MYRVGEVTTGAGDEGTLQGSLKGGRGSYEREGVQEMSRTRCRRWGLGRRG